VSRGQLDDLAPRSAPDFEGVVGADRYRARRTSILFGTLCLRRSRSATRAGGAALLLVDELDAVAAQFAAPGAGAPGAGQGLAAATWRGGRGKRGRQGEAAGGPGARSAEGGGRSSRRLRGTVATAASGESLARSLQAKGIAGPAYLEAVAAEDTEPLLLLPS
jgi:hypothetical protein